MSERFGKKVRDLKIPEGNGREGAGGGDCLNQSEALLHFFFTLQFGLYQTKLYENDSESERAERLLVNVVFQGFYSPKF